VREEVIAKLMELTPEEFEHFSKRLLQAMDFEDTSRSHRRMVE
jgi:hypothetical protein